MEYVIDRNVLGTKSHLLVKKDDSSQSSVLFSWTNDLKEECWYFTNSFKDNHSFCLDTLLRLNGVETKIEPEQKWIKSQNLVSSSSLRPWSLIIPPDEYSVFLKNAVNILNGNLKDILDEYYRTVWVPSSGILQKIVPCSVDKEKFEKFLSEAGLNKSIVEKMRPDKNGFCKRVEYDRFRTRTGRLVVKDGPDVLAMKKQYRSIFKSSFDKGKIISVDFSSLEARVLLFEKSEQDVLGGDIYDTINETLFNKKFDRKTVKLFVLAEVYGSGINGLRDIVNISSTEIQICTEKIKRYFGIYELRKRLREQFVENGFITNRFGRRVEIDDSRDHILVNSYAQSTGVDVSLLGFSSLVKIFPLDKVRPMFVIHDEVYLDVHEDHVKDILNLKELKIETYKREFSIKAKIV